MNQKSLELQIQATTQRDIANLKHDVLQLVNAYETVDINMKQAYSMTVIALNKITIRVNFLIEELKEKYSIEPEKFEEKFKIFEKRETEKMQEQIVEAIKKQKEELENKVLENQPTEGKGN